MRLPSLILFLTLPILAHTSTFWWGVATSPYQTEDKAITKENPMFFKTDWDIFYEHGKIKEPKGDGVFSYSQYERDLKAIKELGVTHYRFGIEWARIEPKEGIYNLEALAHYKKIAQTAVKMGITPVICLWHWTFPDWGYEHGSPERFGWLNNKVSARWPLYVNLVINEFKELTSLYAPQNEPNAQSLAGFFLGIFPPGEKYNLSLYRKHIDAAAKEFIVAAKIIKERHPQSKVMSIQNMIYWEQTWWDFFSYFYNLGNEFNYSHLEQIKDSVDIIGFNYYYKVKASPFSNPRIIEPEGLSHFLKELSKKYQKPLLITENGWPDSTGKIKDEYFKKHIEVVKKLKEETQLLGYFYWSLLDNFEWSSGYKEKYGLFKMMPDSKSLEPYSVAESFKQEIIRDRK